MIRGRVTEAIKERISDYWADNYAQDVPTLLTALAQAEREREEVDKALGDWLKGYDNQRGAIMNLRQVALTAKENSEALRAEVERLKDILRADGLDPDMPIPPGLKLRVDRAEADLARVRALLDAVPDDDDEGVVYLRNELRAALESQG